MGNTFWTALGASSMSALVTSTGIYVIRRFEQWGRKNIIYFICFAAGSHRKLPVGRFLTRPRQSGCSCYKFCSYRSCIGLLNLKFSWGKYSWKHSGQRFEFSQIIQQLCCVFIKPIGTFRTGRFTVS